LLLSIFSLPNEERVEVESHCGSGEQLGSYVCSSNFSGTVLANPAVTFDRRYL
jgi:hypothetical protein